MRRLIIIATILIAACSKPHENAKVAKAAAGGNADHGKQLIQQYGCQACHTVPGVPGPMGVIGPPLDKMALRGFIAGKVQNSPANLAKWLQDPQALDPGNAMPNLGVTPADARDIAAYLFTLK
ncbi:MAG TPA: c-type cytochrome [Thermoanaerobaculia bacterium]|nr:c-type cytochrome [Thermoanaerobaculia bacterium]